MKAALSLALLLSGCGLVPEKDPTIERDIAQQTLDRLVPACRDGVQYLISAVQGSTAEWGMPRMKPDGTMYRCKVVKEPGRVVEEWEQ